MSFTTVTMFIVAMILVVKSHDMPTGVAMALFFMAIIHSKLDYIEEQLRRRDAKKA